MNVVYSTKSETVTFGTETGSTFALSRTKFGFRLGVQDLGRPALNIVLKNHELRTLNSIIKGYLDAENYTGTD